MGVQAVSHRPVRINKLGNSQGVVIPKSALQAAGLSVGDRVDFYVSEDGALILRAEKRRFRAPRKITASELFADYHGSYRPDELDWGNPTGGEMW